MVIKVELPMVYFSFSPIQGVKKGGVKAAAKPKATQKVNDHHVLHLLEEINASN